VCWDHHHIQAISAEELRLLRVAPRCMFIMADGKLCWSAIWAVKHDGEPTTYVGRPPHHDWASWADCPPLRPLPAEERRMAES
jgi:hypothetical protein